MKKIALLSLVACSFLSTPVYAEVSCPGKIRSLGVASDGNVTVDNGYGIWVVCNVNKDVAGTNPNACKAWAAQLISAKAADASVSIYLSGSAQCATAGTWVNVPAYYISQ